LMRDRIGRLLGSTGYETAGSYGYQAVDVAGYGRVMWKSRRDGRGYDVLIDLSGQAMEYIRETLVYPAELLINVMHRLGFKVTRCDVALDCYDHAVTMKTVLDHMQLAGGTVTHAQTFNVVQGKTPIGQKMSEDGRGMTIYIGNRQSSRFGRIYDKKAEKHAKTGDDIAHCTRFELESKAEAADAVASRIANRGLGEIPSLIATFIDFVEPEDIGSDSNKARRTRVGWWKRLVDKDREPLGLKKGMATPQRTVRWLKEQVSKAILLSQKVGVWNEVQAVVSKTTVQAARVRQWRAVYQPELAEQLFVG